MSEIELSKSSNYWIYGVIAAGFIAIIIVVYFVFFRKRKYGEEYTTFKPSGRAIKVDVKEKPPEPQKPVAPKPKIKTDVGVKEKYKEKLRNRYGL